MEQKIVFRRENITLCITMLLTFGLLYFISTLGVRDATLFSHLLREDFLVTSRASYSVYQVLYATLFSLFLLLTLFHQFLFTGLSFGKKYIMMILFTALILYILVHSNIMQINPVHKGFLETLENVMTLPGLQEILGYILMSLQVFLASYTLTNLVLMFFYRERQGYLVFSFIGFMLSTAAYVFLEFFLQK